MLGYVPALGVELVQGEVGVRGIGGGGTWAMGAWESEERVEMGWVWVRGSWE